MPLRRSFNVSRREYKLNIGVQNISQLIRKELECDIPVFSNYVGPKYWEFKFSEFSNGWDIWDKVFKNGPNKNCGRQPLKSLKEYVLLK